MFDAFLQRDDDLIVQAFEFPDRVAHVFWRVVDPKHPAYDAKLAAEWGDALLKSYQLMDEIVMSGGIIGKVVHVEEKRLTLKTAENTRITVDRSRIAAVLDTRGEEQAE